ncbi:MAG: LIM domain-containing protein [Casimicrobiaceae bacterium]
MRPVWSSGSRLADDRSSLIQRRCAVYRAANQGWHVACFVWLCVNCQSKTTSRS